MSALLFVFIPMVLLGLVATLCFVGCALIYDYSGYTELSSYQSTVTTDPNVVAFWPLNDAKGSMNAADIAPKQPPLMAFNGTYTGAATPGQTAIVTADTGSNCAFFSGGFVNVDFHQELNTSSSPWKPGSSRVGTQPPRQSPESWWPRPMPTHARATAFSRP